MERADPEIFRPNVDRARWLFVPSIAFLSVDVSFYIRYFNSHPGSTRASPETVPKAEPGVAPATAARNRRPGEANKETRPPGTRTWLRAVRWIGRRQTKSHPVQEARDPAENRHGGAPRGEARRSQGASPRLASAGWSRLASAAVRLSALRSPRSGREQNAHDPDADAPREREKPRGELFDIVNNRALPLARCRLDPRRSARQCSAEQRRTACEARGRPPPWRCWRRSPQPRRRRNGRRGRSRWWCRSPPAAASMSACASRRNTWASCSARPSWSRTSARRPAPPAASASPKRRPTATPC